MATIKEIAKKAGVSIGTVDRVLHNRGMVNAQTKERVLGVMKELNYRPNQVAQGLARMKKKLKIGFFLPDIRNHPFFKEVVLAAKRKAKELEEYGVQVSFYQIGEDEPLTSVRAVYQNMLAEQDGIVTLGVDIPETRLYLEQAYKKNIPVVFYNAYIEGQEFLAYVGCDYLKSGALAAGLSALAGGEDARVCIFSEGIDYISSHRKRADGFCREASCRYPKMKVLDFFSIGGSREENEQTVGEMFRKYPDVNIVYVINPRDYEICRMIACADKKRRVRMITNDLVEEQIEMLRQGTISATVCQEPEKQGTLSLEILFQYLAYGRKPKEQLCYTNLSIHIAQNL